MQSSVKYYEELIELTNLELNKLSDEIGSFEELEEMNLTQRIDYEKTLDKHSWLTFYLNDVKHKHSKALAQTIGLKQSSPQQLEQYKLFKNMVVERFKYIEFDKYYKTGDSTLQFETTLNDVLNSQSFYEFEYIKSGSLLLSDLINQNQELYVFYQEIGTAPDLNADQQPLQEISFEQSI